MENRELRKDVDEVARCGKLRIKEECRQGRQLRCGKFFIMKDVDKVAGSDVEN